MEAEKQHRESRPNFIQPKQIGAKLGFIDNRPQTAIQTKLGRSIQKKENKTGFSGNHLKTSVNPDSTPVQRQINIAYYPDSKNWDVKGVARPPFDPIINELFKGRSVDGRKSLNHIFSSNLIQNIIVAILQGNLTNRLPQGISPSMQSHTEAGINLRRLTKMIIPDEVDDELLKKRLPENKKNDDEFKSELKKKIINQREHSLSTVDNLDKIFTDEYINYDDLINQTNGLEYTLHNSAANLRIGKSDINSSIREKIDPLNGEFTSSEEVRENVRYQELTDQKFNQISINGTIPQQKLFAKQMHKYMRLISKNPNLNAIGFKFVKKNAETTSVYTSDSSSILTDSHPAECNLFIKHPKIKDNSVITITHDSLQTEDGKITNITNRCLLKESNVNLSINDIGIDQIIKEVHEQASLKIRLFLNETPLFPEPKEEMNEVAKYILSAEQISTRINNSFEEVIAENIQNEVNDDPNLFNKTVDKTVNAMLNFVVEYFTKNYTYGSDVESTGFVFDIEESVFYECKNKMLAKDLWNDEYTSYFNDCISQNKENITTLAYEALKTKHENEGLSMQSLKGTIIAIAENYVTNFIQTDPSIIPDELKTDSEIVESQTQIPTVQNLY